MALLYLASTIELLAANVSKMSLDLTNEMNLKKAATWAILGIALTLIAGLVAGANTLAAANPHSSLSASVELREGATGVSFMDLFLEYGGLLVPSLILGKWWAYHVRGSRIVDVDLLVKELDETYRRELLKELSQRHGMRATKDELFIACSKRLVASRLVSGLGSSFGVSGRLVRLVPAELVDKLTFTYQKMEALLVQLEKEQEINVDGGVLALKGALPPA
jgi:hypothetical protein